MQAASKPLVGTIATVANAIVDPRAGNRHVSPTTGFVALLEATVKSTLFASIGAGLIAPILRTVAIIIVHPAPTNFLLSVQTTEHTAGPFRICVDVTQSDASERII